MSSWPTKRLGDICTQVTVGHVGKMSDQYIESGVPFLRSQDIRPGFIDTSNLKFISEEFHGRIRKSRLNPGDVTIVRTGYPGTAAVVPESLPEANCSDLVIARPGPSLQARFLAYVLNSPWGRGQIGGRLVGAAQQHFNVRVAQALEIPFPPLETQRRIASILGAYDDLIEVNRRRIAVLEEMARGLFAEWFVSFRFPGHEAVSILNTQDGPLPEGWHYAALNEIAEVAFGFAFKSKAFSTTPEGARVVRIRDVPDGTTQTWTTEPFDPRYAVVNGDVLIGMDGIFHMALWVGGDAALNQRVTRLRPINGYSKGWVFLSVYPHIKFFEATISGTTVAHLGAKHLSTIRVPVADPVTQAKADRFFAPIDDELVNLRVANQRLAASRDLLLPRLISGQLSVTETQGQLEEAA